MKNNNNLTNLKQQLNAKNNLLPQDERRISSVKKEFQINLNNEILVEKQNLVEVKSLGIKNLNETPNQNEEELHVDDSTYDINNVKIIGITGSRGKSTTAFVVHEYLKTKGYKSILYSSIQIDSPASFVNVNEACEIPVQNENVLMDIIEEAEAYQADYIVMEINESTIVKGLTKGIPFSIRALTNINPKHNEEQYKAEEYVNIKKSFFEDINSSDECICVFGLTDFSKEEFNQLLSLNDCPSITYGTKYLCGLRSVDDDVLDCLLYDLKSDLNGLDMKIKVKEQNYAFKTKVILPHNAINFTCAIAILEALQLFDGDTFNRCLEKLEIPGREVVIKAHNKTIVIGLFLMPALENFKKYQASAQINKIRVVTGATGTGFVSWDKSFASARYLSQRSKARSFAMNYVKNNADAVYLTSCDNAAESALSIALQMQGYLNEDTNTTVSSKIIIDRKEAIKKAILEAEENDLIYIAGRGNRRVHCDTATTMKLFQDQEIVEEVLKEMGW